MGNLVGGAAMLCSVVFIGLVLWDAGGSDLEESEAGHWIALTLIALTAGVLALAVSEVDPHADKPFCYAWASVAAAAAGACWLCWRGRAKPTWHGVGLGFLAMMGVSIRASDVFGVA